MDNRKLVAIEQGLEILNRCASTFNVVTISRVKGPLRGVIKSGRKELKGLRGAKIKGKSSEQGVWSNDEAINR